MMTGLNTILVVEDDRMTRQMLREILTENDFVVLEASRGQRSVEILENYSVSIILLDLYLPDADGFEFISAIRAHSIAPILIVSGEADNEQRVQSINEGADDFIPKPIDFKMLLAKINAHIRRGNLTKHEALSSDHVAHLEHVRFKDWTINKNDFQIYNQTGQSAGLTLKEFQLLESLIINAGRTLPREELCETIKEKNYVPSPRAIDVKITRIRKKIGDDAINPDIIQTVRGVGYMFNGNST